MVNTGKPSMACATCKTRRIKCDRLQPECSQCIRSGWTCPGIPSTADIMFRHHRTRRAPGVSQHASIGQPPEPRERHRIIDLSPAVTDRATAFFLYQYAFSPELCSSTGISPGVHEHLPVLLQHEPPTGALNTIVAAAGLAALANAGASAPWKFDAYRSYGKALEQLRVDLKDPVRMKSDSTLAAVMLMGTFEMISDGDLASMESFGRHIVAGAQCVQLRGPSQFRNLVSVILFIQLRRLIIMTCHQLQEPLPYTLKVWSRWTENPKKKDEASLNRFSELNEELAAVRAEIKQRAIQSPAVVAAMLEPIDHKVEDWRSKLPDSWNFKSYRSLGPSVNPAAGGQMFQYDEYPDFWVASTWNNYRMVRILIHESILMTTMKYGTDEEKSGLKHSAKVLAEMTNGVCSSVPYIMGDRCRRHYSRASFETLRPDLRRAKPGGYTLLWPLFLAGSLSTTPKDQRDWIALVLREMGLRMGMQLAISMAIKLEQTTSSFSDPDLWLIGEFFPR
ncbi:hypothetical protein M441DRAFT_64920 [Trichoderma asperellum CBS 433.97]|uniref:Zn(2)-C6 fungal-type domain-containing protein n=1 Tax=Trichoderma asperellum (strain ATCC 204424 / CBS 433.97 / NBRC 101777) TaxID=1042311 RepID=A0A2T3ZKB0_TRIA4|nr:hypothetical protein M441DRAFT_64920 [Trichoderma asperellum CBS 433.97]PTB45247.1 hypothetical protein M441DRAFT_64920 [Trichoderma asperellum CBS 433.97]